MKGPSGVFTSVAPYYARYRVEYPKELFADAVTFFRLDGTGRILDLGCGTGELSIPLAGHVKELVGVDVEKEMLDEAAHRANEVGIENCTWACMRAEDIDETLGAFRLVTLGRSLHWMEQATVLKQAYDLLERGGGLLVARPVSVPLQDGWTRDENEWKEIQREVVRRYLGPKRRAGDSLYTEPSVKVEGVFRALSFRRCDTWTYRYSRTWTLEEAVKNTYSHSFAAPRLFGERMADFENELREMLRNVQPSGEFVEHVVLQAHIALK